MRKILLYTLILFTFSTCKKAEERTCFKTPGSQATKEVALPSFSSLYVGEKIEVVLVQDTQHKIVIHGGKNIISQITYDIDEKGTLKLENNNKCDFLNNYKKRKVIVEVHVVLLEGIRFQGTEDLTTRNTLNVSSFSLMIQDGSATAYLDLNCTNIWVGQGHGFGNFVLSGSTKDLTMRIRSNGYGDTRGLSVSDNLSVVSSSPVTSYINANGTNLLQVQINGSGNMVYTGIPNNIKLETTDKGQLIKQ